MIPKPAWLSRDTGYHNGDTGDLAETLSRTIDSKYVTYALVAGTGIALIAPNRFKAAGIGLAVLSGAWLVIVSKPPAPTAQQ